MLPPILPPAICYLRALPVSLSVPRALLRVADTTEGLLGCPPRVVPPARDGPQIKKGRGSWQPSSIPSSYKPAFLSTHLYHQGTVVGVVISGGSWDLSEAKEMEKEWGDKGSKAVTEVFQDQEDVCLSLGPGVGFLTPKKILGLGIKRAGSLCPR